MRVLSVCLCAAVALVLTAPPPVLGAAVGTGFSYQGRLVDDGIPYDGTANLEFRLYDDTNVQVGAASIHNNVPVTRGLFTVSDVNGAGQFGVNAFNGQARKLGITVNGTAMSPVPFCTAVPYALYALNVPTALWSANGSSIYNTNSGNVGIGTSTPSYKLEVAGNTGGDLVASVHNSNTAGSECLFFGTSSGTDAGIFVWGSTHPTTPGKWRFFNNKTSANFDWVSNGTPRMILDTGGNLGIGTTTPAARLHVAGSAVVSNNLGVGTTAPVAKLQVSGGDALISGNVGIGTVSPAAKLQVSGGNVVVDNYLCVGTTTTAGKLHVSGGDLYVDDYASSPSIVARRANGTSAAPTAVTSGNVLGFVGGGGYDGSTWSAAEAYMDIYAAENWTATAHGCYMRFITTPAGTTASYERMRVDADGNIGIGTTAPDVKLHVIGGSDVGLSGGGFLQTGSTTAGNIGIDDNEIMARNNGAAATLYLNNEGGNVLINGSGDGDVGIGTSSPGGRLHVVGTTGYGIRTQTTGSGSVALFAYGGPSGYAADFRGNVRIWDYATNDLVIELGTGLDYAEGFDVADAASAPAGTVLVIDPKSAGQLTVSHRAYDTCVAGIVAGAKGLGSGVRLGCGRYDRDVALAGRVYCNVDATLGAVEPGDLLTTSDTPGHAMKAVDRAKAQGAILGKAMQRLEKGQKGQILVLVTLQ